MPEKKRDIRTDMRARRRGLSARQQQQAANQLATHVCRQGFFRHARRLAFYLPNDGELDPTPILELAVAAGKQAYLPVLDPLRARTLHFVRWQPGEPLVPNRFGIPEPSLKSARFAPPWTLDVVFMPLVAFDGTGNRLGMGGGFYDRTLAHCYQTQRQRPRLVGVAHHFQQLGCLPADPWDIPLHAVATERCFLSFTRA
jgi:5-formyltetrahydrofolate cyclo-ligase